MESLPCEILTQIFAHFESQIPYDSWEQSSWPGLHYPPPITLRAISHVCRKFHKVARQLMYRTVAVVSETTKHDLVMDALLRTLCADPQLGRNIRNLRLDFWRTEMDMTGMVRGLLAASDGIDERQRRWLKAWLSSPRENTEDDVVFISLVLAPRLRVLDLSAFTSDPWIGAYLSGNRDIEAYYVEEDIPVQRNSEESNTTSCGERENAHVDTPMDPTSEWYEEEYHRLITSSPSDNTLPDLKEVRCRHPYATTSGTISAIGDLLLHPGLETLRLLGFTWTQKDVKAIMFDHLPSNLKVLQLDKCLVDEFGLQNILCRCKQLRHLSIALPGKHRVHYLDMYQVDLPRMGDVFRKYGTHLESFELDTVAYRGFFHAVPPFGSLGMMKSLRHLKIGAADLADLADGGYDTDYGKYVFAACLKGNLPPALESLHVIRAPPTVPLRDPQALKAVCDVLKDKSLAALCKVELEFSGRGDVKFRDIFVPGWNTSESIKWIFNDLFQEIGLDPRTQRSKSRRK